MSEYDKFDHQAFFAQFSAELEHAADVAAVDMESDMEVAEAQATFLNDLDRKDFGGEVQNDLAIMDEFMQEHPGEVLDVLFGKSIAIGGIAAAGLRKKSLPLDFKPKLERAHRFSERVAIVMRAAGERMLGTFGDKIAVLMFALTSELINPNEAHIWATEINRLLDGDGIDLQDNTAVLSAAADYITKNAARDANLDAKRRIRTSLEEKLPGLYTLFNISEHDNLERLTADLVTFITWESDGGFSQFNSIRAQALKMSWMAEKFDLIVTELRALKRRSR